MTSRSTARLGRPAIAAACALALCGTLSTVETATAAEPLAASSHGTAPHRDVAPAGALAATTSADWPQAGHEGSNSRANPVEKKLTPKTVRGMKPRWVAKTGGNVSTTPTVVGNRVFVPDWGGNLSAFDARTGRTVWRHRVSEYSGIPNDLSRTSPAYANGTLYFGDKVQHVDRTRHSNSGVYLMSARASNGARGWRTRVETDPTAIITQSPTVVGGVVYVGVSSNAEGVNGPTHFRGSMLALSARTGKILWKTPTIPAKLKGYTGAAIWGSSPSVDTRRGLVYVTTGNNEDVPKGVCTRPGQAHCKPVSRENHVNSIMALNIRTGAIKWSRSTVSSDVWTAYKHKGPDFDFGSGVNRFSIVRGGKKIDVVGAGQKSGVYWALNADTGKVVWSSNVGPGSVYGGIMWGTAVDHGRIFVSINNRDRRTTPVTKSTSGTSTTRGGFWAALDARTGKVLWRTAAPGGALAQSAMTTAAGVVYGGSTAAKGPTMFALDARTGKILWRHASGGAVIAGAAVSRGTAYWGSGYRMAPDNKLYAFSTR